MYIHTSIYIYIHAYTCIYTHTYAYTHVYTWRICTSCSEREANVYADVHNTCLTFQQKLKKLRTQIYIDLRYIDPQARVLNYFYK